MVAAIVGPISTTLAAPASAVTIPSSFFTVTDQQGANDITGNSSQNDLTQMGRDETSTPGVLKLFWSWDSTDKWTGTGQTGDACALFDSDGDGNINFAVCGQIHNENANPNLVTQTTGGGGLVSNPNSPYVFSCGDSKNDRCTQASVPQPYTSAQVSSGVLGTLATSPPANLITDTDPFPAPAPGPGDNYPNDSTLQINILKSYLPTNSVLVNVCSYPSTGGGANNNPFDCITTPGGGFLKIVKTATPSDTTVFPFTVNPVPSGQPSVYEITGSGETDPIGLTVGTSTEAITEAVPGGWDLTAASCVLSNNTGTGTKTATGVTGVTIQSGLLTTCTFTDVKQNPALKLTKTASPKTYSAVGDSISYSYLVENTGNVKLANPVTIADDKLTVTCPSTNTVGNNDLFLDPGEKITCTKSYSITQADLNAGSITNKATASAGGTQSNEDTQTVTAVQSPALKLTKTASPKTYSAVGDSISYSYLVENTGNVKLANPVTIADDKLTVTCPSTNTVGNNDLFLDPGEKITCTKSYSITQADLNAGSISNKATASAGGTQSNEDTQTVTATQTKTVSLVKTATPGTYSKVGDVISYSYDVKNTGNVTLTGPVTVTDDKATVTCPAGDLAPGATITCSASYTITQADLDSGSVKNIAQATVNGIDSNKDDETVTAEQSKTVSLVKTATPGTYSKVGDVISYSYDVKNTGNVTLTGPVTVTDDKATVTCPAGDLAPGATITCSASYTITQADLDSGSVKNIAQATVNGIDSNKDDETVTAEQSKTVSLVKTATPGTYSKVGDVISYSYDVKNTGNVTLTGPVTVTDDKATVTCPAGDLAPGATITCSASYTITQADLDSGSVKNIAQATVNGIDSNKDDETVTAEQSKTVSLVKTATPGTYSKVGDVISYSYDVKNTGNVTLTGPVTVTDDKATVTCPAGDLAPGATITCSASYTITQADLDSGSVKNIAQATVNGIDSNKDDETVTAEQSKTVSLVKTATPGTYSKVGDVISYSYDVKNTGNVTLTGPVTVTDDKATVTCPAGDLAPGATITCSASYTITQADLDSGSVKNIAQATVNGIDSNKDDETVTAEQSRDGVVGQDRDPGHLLQGRGRHLLQLRRQEHRQRDPHGSGDGDR